MWKAVLYIVGCLALDFMHERPIVTSLHHDYQNGLQILPENTQSGELMESILLVGRWMEMSKWRHGRGRKERLEQIPEITKPRQNQSQLGTPELEERSKKSRKNPRIMIKS